MNASTLRDRAPRRLPPLLNFGLAGLLLLGACSAEYIVDSSRELRDGRTENRPMLVEKKEQTAPKIAGNTTQAIASGDVAQPPAEYAEIEQQQPPFNTEAYDRIYDNAFLDVKKNPLSTFSVDVDTASYSIVRRYLTGGSRPPKDAVRIEELVNYFDYGYAGPTDAGQPFAVHTETAPAPWNPEHRLLRIGIQARRMESKNTPPRNLVFLLDVSGSMDEPNKLPLLKKSLLLLTEQMNERDHVAIVVYAGASGLVLPPTAGNRRADLAQALENLQAGGSTNGGEGIMLAYKTARENFRKDGINRVILATDGDFNVGLTNEGDLTRLVEKERESGVFLTVLGFGDGNYKDATMEKLADKGNGNYAYIDTIAEARKSLVNEAGQTLVTIAKDVKLQLEFNPRVVGAYRLIGYENRVLRDEDFNDDNKDAGEIGAGHNVTALYEIVPAGQSAPVGTVDPLKYQKPGETTGTTDEMLTIKIRYKAPDADRSLLSSFVARDAGLKKVEQASESFRFAAAVAAYGMLLRDSEHKGTANFDQVRALAKSAVGGDEHGYRAEFVRLVEMARDLR